MKLEKLMQEFPDDFFTYAEKILDGYFGNIFITNREGRILYVNQHMADSIHMTKDEITDMTLDELRSKKLWLRSLSDELYNQKKAPFNAYNVSAYGNEIFTHVEPIYDDNGELVMGAQYSIPKDMLNYFSSYIDREKKDFNNYKNIFDYLDSHSNASTLICESPLSKRVFDDAAYYASIDGTVLMSGETGTGKDVLANYIYNQSKRADQPFIPVNCSAIPEELMESEFFGYEKGAFTGAKSSGKPGLFEMADKGTLFLDEIGELPFQMQAKLLRVLETGEFMRVGGTKMIHTDVRILAATNRNLRQMVEEKQFREDLYYRLNVMLLEIPPLRERKEDILPMANLFLERCNKQYNLNRTISQNMKDNLLSYDYPGNIRELRNIMERYTITGREEFSGISQSAAPSGDNDESTIKTAADKEAQEHLPLHEACSRFEQEYIKRAMDECGGRVSDAADMLGIHRSLLYKKLKK